MKQLILVFSLLSSHALLAASCDLYLEVDNLGCTFGNAEVSKKIEPKLRSLLTRKGYTPVDTKDAPNSLRYWAHNDLCIEFERNTPSTYPDTIYSNVYFTQDGKNQNFEHLAKVFTFKPNWKNPYERLFRKSLHEIEKNIPDCFQ